MLSISQSALGSMACSMLRAYGAGTSGALILSTGPSRSSKAASWISLAIVPENPPVFQVSSITAARLVFRTDSTTVSMSKGLSVLKSMISAEMFFSSNIFAASSATLTIPEYVIIVTSVPGLTILALPNGIS